MFFTESQRLSQIHFLARLRAHQRGASFIETGDLLAALVVEDQGGYAKAISVIPPAPRVKRRRRRQPGTSVSISYYLSLGGRLRRGPVPGPKKPFFSPEAANRILTRLDECLARAEPLAWQQEMIMDATAERLWADAAAMVYKPRQWPTEGGRLLAAFILFRLLHHKRVQPMHFLAAALETGPSDVVQVFTDAGIAREKVLDALRAGRSYGAGQPVHFQRRDACCLTRRCATARGSKR